MSGVDEERSRLLGLAYRMLGTWSEAEDVVQQTYERWYRLSDPERAGIREPRAWLSTAASRLCLTHLDSARVRRERYVGPWLPEPIPAHTTPDPGPLDRALQDDSVSTALLVVLEALTPAERVAFVLHEAFGFRFAEVAEILGRTPEATRQLASSARRHIRQSRSRPTDPGEHGRLVKAFADACQAGDIEALIAVLDPQVSSVSDGGGMRGVARRPVAGAGKVARFVLGSLRKRRHEVEIETTAVNG